jgi:hypothetical protein
MGSKLIGTSPSNIQWSNDGKSIYFIGILKNPSDSLLYNLSNKTPVKSLLLKCRLSVQRKPCIILPRSAYACKDGDIFIQIKTGNELLKRQMRKPIRSFF